MDGLLTGMRCGEEVDDSCGMVVLDKEADILAEFL
jgi:hypothetical protein